MARYREISDVLRSRIADGSYPVGSKLPAIARLQDEFGVPGLNTIRDAYKPLVQEGLLRPEQGVGVWVVGTPKSDDETAPSLLEELRTAREALSRAIAYLEEVESG
jgi:DNA-binding GntR family transcriptional regulator